MAIITTGVEGVVPVMAVMMVVVVMQNMKIGSNSNSNPIVTTS